VSHKVFSWVNQESEFLQGEVNGLIRKNLEKLDDRLKKPIELFYFESLSYKEIAKILGLPIGTVMSRIARAKVSLKRDLTRSEAFKVQRERFSDNGSKGKKS
jgi:RNA polymerase sigma-70 factor (ECF subfamily)